MIELEDELMDIVMIFDYYQIPEERQRYLICNGVLFEFSRNDRVKLNCFRFAKLLEMCKRLYANFDVNKMLSDNYQGHDSAYESLVKLFLENEKDEKERQKTIGVKK